MNALLSRVMRFARSPAGRRFASQAMRYARSPEGKARIAQTRERLAQRRRPGSGRRLP